MLGLALSFASCEATTGGDPGGEGEGEICGAVHCPLSHACVDGACLPRGTDGDGDGALVDDDCDDADPDVGPGTQLGCSTACGEGTRTCTRGAWTACTAPMECEPGLDAGPDRDAAPDLDAGPDADADAGHPDPEPDAGPDPCDICDPEHHVELANGEPCDCDERWRVVFAEAHGAPVSQVCRDGAWLTYNLDPSDPAACCAGVFAGCEQN